MTNRKRINIKTREQPRRIVKNKTTFRKTNILHKKQVLSKNTKTKTKKTLLQVSKQLKKNEIKKESQNRNFLNCPICNGLIRNCDDLSIHLNNAHSLDEISINTIVHEVQSESNIDQVTNTAFNSNEYEDEVEVEDGGEEYAIKDDYDEDLSEEEDDNEKEITNYKEEINMICQNLNLEYKKDVKFIELQLLYAKCCLCDTKPSKSLIEHINEVHNMTLSKITAENNCFLCGKEFENRRKLVLHQDEIHGLVSFTTVNHVCKISLDRKFKSQDGKQKKRKIEDGKYTASKKNIYVNDESVSGENQSIAIQFIQNELDPLYDQNIPETKFAVLLMLKLFKRDELIGKQINQTDQTDEKEEIDKERIDFIKNAMFKRFSKDACWIKCVKAMNEKILTLKSKDYTTEELNDFEKERMFLYKLMNMSIKSEELQKLLKERIEYTESRNFLNNMEIKRIFNECETAHHFATNLMLKLFNRSELDPKYNVYGRTYKKDIEKKYALDPERIGYIRLLTFKHFNISNKKACWAKCVRTMNNKIRNMSRTTERTKQAIQDSQNESIENNQDDDDTKQVTHLSDDLINHLHENIESYELDKNELDFIRESVETPFNFCAKLLLKIFTKCELINSNVYGRIFNRMHEHKQALDETRVDYIKNKMFEYYPCNNENEKKLCWSRCVKAMNDKLSYIQKLYRLNQLKSTQTDKTVHQHESQKVDENCIQKLSKEEINYLYRSTVSPAHFSVRLMLKIFSSNELNTGKNVYGRTYRRDAVHKEALDPNRIDFIYDTVFKYYPSEIRKTCWSRCIKSMNDKIRYINKYYVQK